MITVSADRMVELRTAVDLLNLPVRLEEVAANGRTTIVIHGPRDLNTPAEVKVLRLVESYTDDFRWCGDLNGQS